MNILRVFKNVARLRAKAVKAYHSFANDIPGERFLSAYERWKGGGPATSIAIVSAGLLLMIIGILLGLVPGVPGILLGLLGMALIATRFRKAARWMDWSELKLRTMSRRIRHWWAELKSRKRNHQPSE